MWGTLINAGAIVVGSILGLLFHSNIPKKYIQIIFQAIGLFTLFVGIAMALKTSNYLILVFSMVIGAILGTMMDLEKLINRFSEKLKTKIKTDNNKFSEGMISAFLLYCMGSMTILGAFEEGLGSSPNLLLAKSLMDGVSSIALSAGLGVGVIFSVVPLMLYQGGLTLFANLLNDKLSEPIINELSAVGGLMLIGMGLNILEIAKIKVINLLPALVIVVVLVWLFL
ncbi:MAG TPA: DUF554 domain-containing protein [Marinilabiliales bacterium]|nr:MAG: hypothetical protein A2W95_09715 [Bacteroidetes bacterium GWA2_40_14]OFX60419.1 MAG: hypothetical protein A2W84_04840 [Bacteroidetes bacterium GWC2_40_13]OFX74481.1 MAG: hypothetical protein A2W96_02975 [Bacteroidetes bacterium GWD2_40_43]OFX91881.1 MAG: hypothetical protein A2W97_11945 [Bacteroidetes bacterium GWE2_40_63]OFY19821.1 MAG: hypothetical protein A2W88_03490 [Bacteroidetes bacterium GWF2_40_13]OFZ28232.1 MAG: hypothetical protein A2437_04995 [Bacteroidetes bacterium RIFOXYC